MICMVMIECKLGNNLYRKEIGNYINESIIIEFYETEINEIKTISKNIF